MSDTDSPDTLALRPGSPSFHLEITSLQDFITFIAFIRGEIALTPEQLQKLTTAVAGIHSSSTEVQGALDSASASGGSTPSSP